MLWNQVWPQSSLKWPWFMHHWFYRIQWIHLQCRLKWEKTARQRNCEKVMFSQASVSDLVHKVVGPVWQPGDTHPTRLLSCFNLKVTSKAYIYERDAWGNSIAIPLILFNDRGPIILFKFHNGQLWLCSFQNLVSNCFLVLRRKPFSTGNVTYIKNRFYDFCIVNQMFSLLSYSDYVNLKLL